MLLIGILPYCAPHRFAQGPFKSQMPPSRISSALLSKSLRLVFFRSRSRVTRSANVFIGLFRESLFPTTRIRIECTNFNGPSVVDHITLRAIDKLGAAVAVVLGLLIGIWVTRTLSQGEYGYAAAQDGVAGTEGASHGDEHNPTALETWYFIFHQYEVKDQPWGKNSDNRDFEKKVIEETENRIVTEQWRYTEGLVRETWTINNCVVKLERESHSGQNFTRYFFLNNVDREIVTKRVPDCDRGSGCMYNAIIRLNAIRNRKSNQADIAVMCETRDGGNYCSTNAEIDTWYDPHMEARIMRALQYLYGNFCRFGNDQKPF